MIQERKPYGTVLVGAILVCVGLVLAVLSNPARFSLDPSADTQILLLVLSGFACTVFGLVLLLSAASATTKSMPPEMRSRANTGVGIGSVLQLAGLFLVGGAGLRALVGLLLLFVSVPGCHARCCWIAGHETDHV